MRAEPDREAFTIETRLHKAAEALVELWAGCEAHAPGHTEPLAATTAEDLRADDDKEPARLEVRMVETKKLLALPRRWPAKLGELVVRWEAAGAWPESIRRALYAMIPKSKAENEAQLRPIGLLPYAYRVWISIRKRQR